VNVILQDDIRAVVKALDKGAVVGVPTETVYGLAVRADDTAAIRKLLRIKDRHEDSGKVLSLMLPEVDHITRYAEMEERVRNLALRHFPGELTVVLPKKADFDHAYFDNFETIGVRVPAHEYMLGLLGEVGALLVTSANPRGEAPCVNSEELVERMPEIDAVVEGRSGGNLPSTVIDLTVPDEPVVLRQGGLLLVRYY
jgi:L-threonylcarbamoyladenylate synthase